MSEHEATRGEAAIATQGGIDPRNAESQHAAAEVPAEPFAPAELRQFEADDITAGKAIGKMLSLLFIYTLVAMSIVVWWTVQVVNH